MINFTVLLSYVAFHIELCLERFTPVSLLPLFRMRCGLFLFYTCILLPVHWDVVDVGKLVVSGRRQIMQQFVVFRPVTMIVLWLTSELFILKLYRNPYYSFLNRCIAFRF